MTTPGEDSRDESREPDLLDRAETLSGAFQAMAERAPELACLTIVDRDFAEQVFTVGELWSRARDAQAALQERGLEPGGAVVLVFPTSAELIAGYLGTMLAGGVPAVVATPSNRVADERIYSEHVGEILENASAQVLYCEDAVAALFEGPGQELLHGAALLRVRDVVAQAEPPPVVPIGGDDFATIQYSSGSTGTPKGVLLTHTAMLNHMRAVREMLDVQPGDVSVNWIPLYHDMGLFNAFLMPLLAGCKAVMIPTMDFMRVPQLWLHAISKHRGALSWSPNFGFAYCARRLSDADIEGLDLSSWKVAISAAEPVLAETVEDFITRFASYGFARETMTPAWGLAESGTIVTSHRPGEATRVEYLDREALAAAEGRAVVVDPAASAAEAVPCVSVGEPLPRCEVEIRSAAGEALPERRVGEIWIRTDCLFTAYKDQPEVTARTLVGGWMRTGDIGYLAGGHLYFTSRDKDLIIIGGENYLPTDVESAINRVPGVREGCAVAFGVTSEERGTEELGAVVETREEDPAARSALERAIRQEVARATGLGLRHLVLVDPGGVEKTTSGKLARSATRARWLGAGA